MKSPKIAILLEPSETDAKCISDYLSKVNIFVHIARSPSEAISLADSLDNLDIVISEIALPSNSGSEFLYEFRTYPEWASIPYIIYTTTQIPESVTSSRDWELLGVTAYLYKPKVSLEQLSEAVQGALAE